MPKVAEAMRRVAVNWKRMVASVYLLVLFEDGFDCRKQMCGLWPERSQGQNQGPRRSFNIAADTKCLEFSISLTGARGNNEPTTV